MTPASDATFNRWQHCGGIAGGWFNAEVFYACEKVCIRTGEKQIWIDFETAAALVEWLAPRVAKNAEQLLESAMRNWP